MVKSVRPFVKEKQKKKVNQSGKRAKHVTQHTSPVTFATVPRVLPACCKPIKPHAFCGIDCQQVRRRFDVISGIFFSTARVPWLRIMQGENARLTKKYVIMIVKLHDRTLWSQKAKSHWSGYRGNLPFSNTFTSRGSITSLKFNSRPR